MEVTSSFTPASRVLKGAEEPGRNQAGHDAILSHPLLLTDSLPVEAHRDPGIGMTEQFLRRLDVDPVLPQHRGQLVPKRVETHSLHDAQLLQRWPDLARQNRVR
jgi:hypothetical protein